MSSGDPVQAVAEAIVKQLPVKKIYKDGLQPSVHELSLLGRDLVKALRLALFPVQIGALLQDRFRNAIEKSYARVEPENRIEPAPQILGPVLEAMRYEPDGTPIDELFSQLLSRSMDRSRAGEAHPAFVSFIRQMSPDEASIMKFMSTQPVICILYETDWQRETKIHEHSIDELQLQFPDRRDFYMDHLFGMGLIGQNEYLEREILDNKFPWVTFVAYRIRCTPVGREFLRAVTP